MVGVSMAFHDVVCECFEGTVLEPCFEVTVPVPIARWCGVSGIGNNEPVDDQLDKL